MKFSYYAKNANGEDNRGEMDAKDRFDLARVLRNQGSTLISCKEYTPKKNFNLLNFSLPFFNKISVSEKIIFSRNLGVMISAGLSLSKALNILGKQTKNEKFKNILLEIANDIQKGNTLSAGMKKYPKVFTDIFIAMVRVGEESGKLNESLKIIADQMDRDYTIRKKIKGAMMYPAVVFGAMIIIGILMMIYVVPTLTSTFKDLGVQLPLSTRVIVWISDFIVNNKIIFGISILLGTILFMWFSGTKIGKKIIEIISLKTPIIAPLVKKVNASRTSRTLASLIGSGVNVLEAIDITKDVLQNSYYKKVLDNAKVDIQKGSPISETFKNAPDLYAVLFSEMVAVGEETGKLPEMFFRIAEFYEDQVSETTKNMASIVEPFLMVIIGAAVGFFAISMLTPMYSMLNSI